MNTRPLVAVSACLMGQAVRYDGGHTRAPFLSKQLAEYVDFIPLCPEEGAGMSTPREAVRLVKGADGELRMLGNKTGEDWTTRMHAFGEAACDELEQRKPVGFILKRGSPSCGVFRVRRYNEAGGKLSEKGGGLFAERVMERFPNVVVEEEGRLNDPGLRHQFLIRIFAGHRLQHLCETATGRADVMAFQRREKLLLMAHSPSNQKKLGRMIADDTGSLDDLLARYGELFTKTVAEPVYRGRIVNVLQHMSGYLRDVLDARDAEELQREIAAFQSGTRHSAAVWMLLRHHLRRHDITYLLEQTVTAPYPEHLLESEPDPHYSAVS